MPSRPSSPARRATAGRRAFVLGGAAAAGAAAVAAGRARAAEEPEARFMRIGTGNVNGTYYLIGGLIAEVVSRPPGAPCEMAPPGTDPAAAAGESCGVPGLTAVAQSSSGSVANVDAIQSGEFESGFVQSDVAWGAFTGTGTFAGRPRADRLRALANLYPEAVHLVVRADSPIDGVRGLRGRRVSLDAERSGTIVDARLILAAFGVPEAEIIVSYTPLGPSLDRMKAGELDAFFLVAGWPAPAVSELARDAGVRLLPIDGPEVEGLLSGPGFLTRRTIPAGSYPGVGATPTLAVAAEWVVSRDLSEDLVHALASALWSPLARGRLDAGHPRGALIRPETAVEGVAIPFHPGAMRYYRERGILP